MVTPAAADWDATATGADGGAADSRVAAAGASSTADTVVAEDETVPVQALSNDITLSESRAAGASPCIVVPADAVPRLVVTPKSPASRQQSGEEEAASDRSAPAAASSQPGGTGAGGKADVLVVDSDVTGLAVFEEVVREGGTQSPTHALNGTYSTSTDKSNSPLSKSGSTKDMFANVVTNAVASQVHSSGVVTPSESTGTEGEEGGGSSPARPFPPRHISSTDKQSDGDRSSFVKGFKPAAFRSSFTRATRKIKPQKGILVTDANRNSFKLKKEVQQVRFEVPQKQEEYQRRAWTWRLFEPLAYAADEAAVTQWNDLMVLPLSYEVWAFPYRFALGQPGPNYLCFADLLFDAFFIGDIAVKANTAVTDAGGGSAAPWWTSAARAVAALCLGPRRQLAGPKPMGLVKRDAEDVRYVTDRRELARMVLEQHLPRVLPCFLIYAPAILGLGRWMEHDVYTRVWWVAGLPRLTRSFQLMDYFRSMELKLEVDVYKIQCFKYMLTILLSTHWVGCVFWFAARLEGYDNTTWVATFAEEFAPFARAQDSRILECYCVIMLKGFNSITNLGYQTDLHNIGYGVLSILAMLGQIVLASYILGTLFHYLVQKDHVAEAHDADMAALRQFMAARQLPPDLQQLLVQHFEFQHQKKVEGKKGSEGVLMPRSLSIKVANCQFRWVVEKCEARGELFYGCTSQFLDNLVMSLKEVYYMPGELIVRRGDMARELCFVAAGTAQVMEADTVLRTVRPDLEDAPSVVSEVPFFLGIVQPHSIRAKADADLKLLTLSKHDYDDLVASYPEQHDLITSNIMGRFGLDKNGEPRRARHGHPEDEDEEGDSGFRSIKWSIQQSVRRRTYDDFADACFAAMQGDVEDVRNILRKGLDINMRNYDGRTILHLAALNGVASVCEFLLEEQADRNVVDRWSMTPLQVAINAKQVPIVELLGSWKAGLRLNDPSGALCEAAGAGDIDMLKQIIANGVDPNHGDYDRRYPLHLAAAEGQQAAIEYLLQSNADVHVEDRWGMTPLFDAVKSGNSLVVMLIRKKGGSMSGNKIGAARLCSAAYDGNVQMLQLLSSCKVDLDQGDYDSRTALHLAAAEGKLLAVSFLLGQSADPRCLDRWKSSPLMDALKGGTLYHRYCAKMILGALGPPDEAALSEDEQRALRHLDDISMDEVRRQVKKLINREEFKVHRHISEEDIKVAHTASLAIVASLPELSAGLADLREAAAGEDGQRMRDLAQEGDAALQGTVAFVEGLVVQQRAVLLADGYQRSLVGHLAKAHLAEKMQQMIATRDGLLAGSSAAHSGSAGEEPRWRSVADLLDEILSDLGSGRGCEAIWFDGIKEEADDLEAALYAQADHAKNAKGLDGQLKDLARQFQHELMMNINETETGIRELRDVFRAHEFHNAKMPSAYERALAVSVAHKFKKREHHADDEQVFGVLADSKVLSGVFRVMGVSAVPEEHVPAVVSEVMDDPLTRVHGPRFEDVAFTLPALLSSDTFTAVVLRQAARMRHQARREEAQDEAGEEARGGVEQRSALAAVETMDRIWKVVLSAERALNPDATQVEKGTLLRLEKYMGELGQIAFQDMFLTPRVLPLYKDGLLSRSTFLTMCFTYLFTEQIPHGGSFANDEKRARRAQKRWDLVANVMPFLASTVASVKIHDLLLEATTLRAYESIFVQVTGGKTQPLLAHDVGAFLEQLLPRHHAKHGITSYNVEEFYSTFAIAPDGQVAWDDLSATVSRAKARIEKDLPDLLVGARPGLVLNPRHRLLLHWYRLMKLTHLYVFIMVPLTIAFQPWESAGAHAAERVVLEAGLDALWLLDILINFNTAYPTTSGILVTDREAVYRHYVARRGFIDVLSVLPFDHFALQGGSTYFGHSTVRVASYLRLNRLLRCIPDQGLSMNMFRRVKIFKTEILNTLLHLFNIVSALIHLFACIWYAIGQMDGGTWYSVSYGEGYFARSGQATLLDRYVMSVYWVTACITATTIDGTSNPQSYTELTFVIILLLLNVTIFSYILGEISNAVMGADADIVKLREEKNEIETFIASRNMPQDLQSAVRSHFYATRSGQHVDFSHLYLQMSYLLQLNVAQVLSRDFLDEVKLFKGCRSNFLDSVSVLLREQHLNPEEYLFRVGDVAKAMFFVVRGTLEVLSTAENGTVDLDSTKVLPARSSVGDLSFFFGMRHLNTVRVSPHGPCDVFSLPRTSFQQLLPLYPEAEQRVAQNALVGFDKSRSAMSKTSTHRGTEKSDESQMGTLVGSKMMSAINTLRMHRKASLTSRLLQAAHSGDLPTLAALLESDGNGVSVTVQDAHKRTALHVAAGEGHVAVVEHLLKLGADVHAVDFKHNTPLNEAVRHKHDDAAALIQEFDPGIRVRLPGHQAGMYMCEYAAKGQLEEIQRLVRFGVDVNAPDYDSRTALHLAASEGQTHIVQFLLDSHAKIESLDRFGGTPLEDAIRHQHRAVQDILVAAGARVGGVDIACQLCEAAACGDIDTIRNLVRCGANPSQGDYDKRTALHLAACNVSEAEAHGSGGSRSTSVTVLDFLLGLDPPVSRNPVDRMGFTPMDDAIRHGNKIAEVLLEMAGGVRAAELDGEVLRAAEKQAEREEARARQAAVRSRVEASREGMFASSIAAMRAKFRAQLQAIYQASQANVHNLQAAQDHIQSLLTRKGLESRLRVQEFRHFEKMLQKADEIIKLVLDIRQSIQSVERHQPPLVISRRWVEDVRGEVEQCLLWPATTASFTKALLNIFMSP